MPLVEGGIKYPEIEDHLIKWSLVAGRHPLQVRCEPPIHATSPYASRKGSTAHLDTIHLPGSQSQQAVPSSPIRTKQIRGLQSFFSDLRKTSTSATAGAVLFIEMILKKIYGVRRVSSPCLSRHLTHRSLSWIQEITSEPPIVTPLPTIKVIDACFG